jgi:hypothetical protein
MAAGAALGIAAGKVTEDALRNFIDIPTPEEMPEELRSAGFAGQVLGAGATFVGAPVAAARVGFQFAALGAGKVGRFATNMLNGIIESAGKSPTKFMAIEVSALASAATAEAVAEEIAPGATGARIGAGVVAGFLAPTTLAVKGGSFVRQAFRRFRETYSETARTNRAAGAILAILEEAGEDIPALIRLLKETDIVASGERTAAQLTGSPALMRLERELVNRSEDFGAEVAQAAENSFEAMRLGMEALIKVGHPEALQQAAIIRQEYFRTIIQGTVDGALSDAVEAASRISGDIPTARAELSAQVQAIVGNALKSAREEESRLWTMVDGEIIADADSLIAEGGRIATEDLLPEESLPSVAREFLLRIGDPDAAAGVSSVKELVLFRSRMLGLAREADKNFKANDARIYGNLAEAALKDLNRAVDGTEYKSARDFSFQLNEIFTRTFAGPEAVAGIGRTSTRRLPPELLFKRALGSGGEVAALRIRELHRAVQFGGTDPQAVAAAAAAAEEMLGIQQRVFAIAAADVIDTATGMVNPRKVATFRKNNADLLVMFPEIDAILADASQARFFFEKATTSAQRADDAVKSRAAFSRVAGSENPGVTVNRILNGENPIKEFGQLARLAKAADAKATRVSGAAHNEATHGLQTIVLENAWAKSGMGTETFSWTALHRHLFKTTQPGRPSPMAMMQQAGVITKKAADNYARIIAEAVRIERSLGQKFGLDGLASDTESFLFDFIVRVAGASMGRLSPIRQPTGAGIVVAGAGSRFLRKVLEQIPSARTQGVIMAAAKNPAMMLALLTRSSTKAEKIRLGRVMHAYLWQAGLVQAPEAVGETVFEAAPEQARARDTVSPNAPTTRTVQ